MRKKIFTKIILFCLLLLLLYYTAGATYYTITEGKDFLSYVGPYLALTLVILYLLVQAFRATGVPKAVLENTEKLYAPYIQNAFKEDPANRRRLLALLAVSDKEK